MWPHGTCEWCRWYTCQILYITSMHYSSYEHRGRQIHNIIWEHVNTPLLRCHLDRLTRTSKSHTRQLPARSSLWCEIDLSLGVPIRVQIRGGQTNTEAVNRNDVARIGLSVTRPKISSRATRYIRCRPSPSPTVNVYNMPACPST